MLKGQFHEEEEDRREGGAGYSAQVSKTKPAIHNWKNVARRLSGEELGACLEPLIRKVVREEVSHAITNYFNPSSRTLSYSAQTSDGGGFRLQFVNRPPQTIFTSSHIEADENTPLRIELIDGRTNLLVTSGSLSSIKLQIVTLNGDFGSDDEQADWSEKEFSDNIIREREGKRPLITGELNVALHGGVCYLRNVTITDNSSWMRSRTFRLGARVAQRVSAEVRIREAISVPFVVKDHRGELNKKHHPPFPDDEVWRLEKIAKDGPLHQRLNTNRIKTVRDFLQHYEANESLLRKILGTPVAKKTWETIVGHAKTCVVDDGKLYAYCERSTKVGLLFNSVYELVGVKLDGQSFHATDNLTPPQKIWVQNLKRQAYNNMTEWHALSNSSPQRALTGKYMESPMNWGQPLHHLGFANPGQGQQEPIPEINYSSPSTSYSYDFAGDGQLELPGSQDYSFANPPVESNPPMQDFSPCCGTGETKYHPGCSQGSFGPDVDLAPEQFFQLQSLFPTSPRWGKDHTFAIKSSNAAGFGVYSPSMNFGIRNSRISKPRAAWTKIRAVAKWVTVRRAVAAKRRATF